MSLIKCPECKQEISDQACICIKCGNPISKTAEQQSSLNTAWNAVTTSRTPIDVFALAMWLVLRFPGSALPALMEYAL